MAASGGMIEQRLERLRHKLLDLSTMNRMLSFRHPKASCMRIVDELPAQVFEALVEGATFTFEPVAEPTRRELETYHARRAEQVPRASEAKDLPRPDAAVWARSQGINANYDLPVETDSFERAEHHADRRLQTLHYPDELDARLRKIRAAGRTAIEESGANMLYLAFGFLEWSDQQNSKSHLAPLVLLPVELEREATRGGQFRTKVKWTGEEIFPNLSLKKKLEEFNVALPDLGEEQPLEDYLTDVIRAIRHKTDWTVRRYVTLGLFEFGKILLYLDLDPERWPKNEPLTEVRLVREVLDGVEEMEGLGEDGADWDGDFDDTPRAAERRDLTLEVVDRADSSQCEALEVALSGRNLVIQGPPGTGKSQTITNLVAAALARGKSVLFVAEKLAALEVVRRRMRELGLGDFCLELHSHKTRKTEVLDDIDARLRAAERSRPPRDYEAAQSRLAARREKLAAYIDIVSQPAADFSGLTIVDALMRAGQARRKLGSEVRAVEALRRSFVLPDRIDGAVFADAKSRVRQFGAALDDLGVEGSAFSHIWAGVSSAKVLPHDSEQIAALAAAWADRVDELASMLSGGVLESLGVAELGVLSRALKALAPLRVDLRTADDVATAAEQALGVVLDRSVATAGDLRALAELAAAAPLAELSRRNTALIGEDALKRLVQHQERLARLDEEASKLSTSFRSAAQSADLDDLEEWAAALSQPGLFARFGKRWRAATAGANAFLRPAALNLRPAEKAEALTLLRKHRLETAAVAEDTTLADMLGEGDHRASLAPCISIAEWADTVRTVLKSSLVKPLLFASAETIAELAKLASPDTDGALQRVEAMEFSVARAESYWRVAVLSQTGGAVASLLLSAADDASWDALVNASTECSAAADRAQDAESAFGQETGVNFDLWFGADGRKSLAAVSSQARFASAHPEMLAGWLDFDRAFQTSCEAFDAPLVHAAANGEIRTAILPLALDFLVFDTLAREAFAANPALLSTSGRSLAALREEYAALDAEVMELRRAHIASTLFAKRAPEGVRSGRKADLTDMALVRAEIAKQRRHIPIRQLMARAGDAIQVLKPCFMMGPLSVAQYIAPGSLKFDLVIMDEASQMRPEDAIGALARGGQAVIVGDTKQLPPTSFFDRIADTAGDDEDEDATLAEEAKSILELAEAIFTPRMLRWHYRSRHESLIAFSNRQFYKSDLVVFPSPSGQDGRYGVGWHRLDEGATTTGVNPVEARAVARFAADLLLREPSRSVGVVAMNIKQSQRISDELAALADANPLLAKVLANAENDQRGEPFFVKNLENVQGDERDVIVISMTYGPHTPGGRVPQNFGPINLETGWRRLNVLFTRAKERMEVFSSMRASDIVPREGMDRGPGALKLFLDYAETGRLGVAPRVSDRDPDSDFEHAVLEGLQELNFDCVPQVGVANFFLDIGVCDPGSPGDYIAAIECDGASYHSSKSARDRDRLRQEILENLGWTIIRIWSTDWFRDPQGELARVSADLKRLIATKAARKVRPPEEKSIRTEASLLAAPSLQSTPLKEASRSPGRAVGAISLDQARAELIDIRERLVKPAFPDSDPTKGFLRKSMLDELLRKRPIDMEEFRTRIPRELREATDGEQLKGFSDRVFEVLERIDA